MLSVITGFVDELRDAGVPVSMVEAIDAMEALAHTDVSDRAAFKATLGATLVKNVRHYEAFDLAFEVFFALDRSTDIDAQDPAHEHSDPAEGSGNAGRRMGSGGGEGDTDALMQALMRALAGNEKVCRRPAKKLPPSCMTAWPFSMSTFPMSDQPNS